MNAIAILGTGSYLPEKILTNDDLTRMVDTSDEWIVTRTGIRQRHIAAENQNTSDLAVAAAQNALAAAKLTPADIDLLIVASVTPDYILPSTACLVQTKLGIPVTAACFDINAACTGFLYAIETAHNYLAAGRRQRALVICAEKLTSLTDWNDRATCVLFGDAAGAIILGPAPADNPADSRLLDTHLYADGSLSRLLIVPGGGSAQPIPTPDANRYIHMNGREVFKHAVREMAHATNTILEKNNIAPSQIKHLIPHQANLRIIHALAQHLELPYEKVIINVDRTGNTSAATIPVALDEAVRSGRIQRGDNILLVAFGAGLTYGATLIRY